MDAKSELHQNLPVRKLKLIRLDKLQLSLLGDDCNTCSSPSVSVSASPTIGSAGRDGALGFGAKHRQLSKDLDLLWLSFLGIADLGCLLQTSHFMERRVLELLARLRSLRLELRRGVQMQMNIAALRKSWEHCRMLTHLTIVLPKHGDRHRRNILREVATSVILNNAQSVRRVKCPTLLMPDLLPAIAECPGLEYMRVPISCAPFVHLITREQLPVLRSVVIRGNSGRHGDMAVRILAEGFPLEKLNLLHALSPLRVIQAFSQRHFFPLLHTLSIECLASDASALRLAIFCLPALTRLHVGLLVYSDQSLSDVVWNAPALRDLKLFSSRRARGASYGLPTIVSPKIERLTVTNLHDSAESVRRLFRLASSSPCLHLWHVLDSEHDTQPIVDDNMPSVLVAAHWPLLTDVNIDLPWLEAPGLLRSLVDRAPAARWFRFNARNLYSSEARQALRVLHNAVRLRLDAVHVSCQGVHADSNDNDATSTLLEFLHMRSFPSAFQQLSFSRLHTLRLERTDLATVFAALASARSIRALIVSELLSSFPSALPARAASMLESLEVHSYHIMDAYEPDDLIQLLAAVPKLRNLAVWLCKCVNASLESLARGLRAAPLCELLRFKIDYPWQHSSDHGVLVHLVSAMPVLRELDTPRLSHVLTCLKQLGRTGITRYQWGMDNGLNDWNLA